jgi:hypothetical protein
VGFQVVVEAEGMICLPLIDTYSILLDIYLTLFDICSMLVNPYSKLFNTYSTLFNTHSMLLDVAVPIKSIKTSQVTGMMFESIRKVEKPLKIHEKNITYTTTGSQEAVNCTAVQLIDNYSTTP